MKQSPGEIRDSPPPADVYEIKPPGEEPAKTKCGDGGENVGILSLRLGGQATGTGEGADLGIVNVHPHPLPTPSASAASGSGLKTMTPCFYLATTLPKKMKARLPKQLLWSQVRLHYGLKYAKIYGCAASAEPSSLGGDPGQGRWWAELIPAPQVRLTGPVKV